MRSAYTTHAMETKVSHTHDCIKNPPESKGERENKDVDSHAHINHNTRTQMWSMSIGIHRWTVTTVT